MHLQVTQLHAPARLRAQPQGSPSAEATRFEWLEVVKGVALLWIVWNHLAERLFGFPLAGNPNADWPPLAERLAQLRPLTGHGWLDLPLNLMRWVGWSGDQGVQLFLIAGGFGLTWGLLVRGRGPRLAAAEFWRRRARRIYPLWWAAHLFFVVPCLLLGRGLDPRQLTFWLDLLGVRVTPYALYYFAPAWWYVGLLVQLTAVYPLLWTALRRLGPARFLVAALAISFAVRGAGLLFFHTYLDAWSRGAIFVTRLPEFATGMAVAAWMHAAPATTDAWLRTAATRLAALAAWLVGSVLSLGLLGMTVAPFLLGVGAFGLLYAPASAADRAGRRSRGWGWLGRHSYSLFLMHQPFLAVCVPRGPVGAPERVALGVAAALTMTVVSALALERAVGPGVGWLRRMDVRRVSRGIGSAAAVLAILLVGAEITVRRVAPREVWGWGERPSLEPDDVAGWRLRPATKTRLRWLSYDYVVRANALGFPGPNRPLERAPGMLRVLVTGDAFSSAEGVDTDAAWPRLLEGRLRDRLPGRVVEVLNFSITGYGPNQEAAVVREFAPRFHPDVIVLQSFVNDFDDALTSDAEFRDSIGFARADPRGWRGILGLAHLTDLVKVELLQPLHARLTGTPERRGYHLGSFPALGRGRPELEAGRRITEMRWREISAVARELGGRLVVVAVPAPGEVCAPADLAYWPRGVDLGDESRFDPTRPQRWSAEIAATAGAEFHDLRGVLRAAPCPYQRRNMHWTADGHRRVADAVAGWLVHTGSGSS